MNEPSPFLNAQPVSELLRTAQVEIARTLARGRKEARRPRCKIKTAERKAYHVNQL